MKRRNFLTYAVVTPLVGACGGGGNEDDDPAQPSSAGAPPSEHAAAVGGTHSLSWNGAGGWTMDGADFQFFGGEMHPARVPQQYWDHRIKMIKALGCNTVSLYIMWNFHELPDGSFDFSSPDKNMGHFVDLCAQNGLWVLLRPGPYVCAEWDFGGLPPRMLADPQFRDGAGNLQIRGNFGSYMAAVKKFNTAVYNNVVKGRTLADGGRIMLVGVENEYTAWSPVDVSYPNAIAAQWAALGYRGKFCVCDQKVNGFKQDHITLPADTAYGMTADGKSAANYPSAASNYGVGVFGAECYPGWICAWGEQGQTLHAGDFADQVAALARAKCSFVLYVAHGGTNFGFTGGSNGVGNVNCQPVITSYDYGAPIAEAGDANPNFAPIRDAYRANASYDVPFTAPPNGIAHIADGEVATIAGNQWVYSGLLPGLGFDLQNALPQTIEWMALTRNKALPASAGVYPSGIAVYKTTLPAAGGSVTLSFDRTPDFAVVLVNGVRVSDVVLGTVTAGFWRPTTTQTIGNVPANATLQVVCMPFGRANYGADAMNRDGRGLSKNVYANGQALKNWSMALAPLTESQIDALNFSATLPNGAQPFFARASVSIGTPKDMYLDMSRWGSGYVFVNGRNLGRYWSSVGPQKRLYCPSVWLDKGSNTVVVFELTQTSPGSLSFYGASALPLAISNPMTALVQNGIYTVAAASAPQLLLGSYRAASGQGSRLGIAAASGGSDQRWKLLSAAGGAWRLQHVKSGLMMDVTDERADNSAPLEIWPSTGNANQSFNLFPRAGGGSFAIKGVPSGRVVDANWPGTSPTSYGSTDVSAITLWDDNGQSHQGWIFTRVA